MDINNNDDPMTYLWQNFKYCQSQIKLKNTTTHEIDKIIKSLKNKTSHGYDEISDKILKASAPFIPPLTYIINKVLSPGIFPDRLKYSEVQPLFKKGKKKLKFQTTVTFTFFFKNYRKDYLQKIKLPLNWK